MIKKQEIINVLIDEGLSIVESDRTLDTVENFRLCVQDVEEKAVNERIDPIIKLIERFPTWKKNYIYSYHGVERWFKELKEMVKNEN